MARPRRRGGGPAETRLIVSAGYRRRQAEGGYNHDFAKRESAPGRSACLQCAFTPLAGDLKTTKTDKKHGFTARIASLIG